MADAFSSEPSRSATPVDSADPRLRVWKALSELFLDTELDRADLARIRQVLRASGLPRAELRRILYRDVAPVLGWNALSPAGEWAGWSEAELRRLMPDGERSRGSGFSGWLLRLVLRRHLAAAWRSVDPAGDGPG